MGNAGRFVCVTLPLVFSLACVVCLILVTLGDTNKGSSILRSIYFLRADTAQFSVSSMVGDAAEIAGVQNVADWYTIGLWNYCYGSNDDASVPTFCAGRQWAFWFNPIEVWGLQNTPIMPLIPGDFQDALDAYQAASKWLFIAYFVAIVAAGITPLLACFAYCSRIGSIFTSISSAVAAVFTLGASIVAITVFGAVKGVLDEKLGKYGVKTSLGREMFVITWFATAFACAAVFFWLFSMCCCGADHSKRKQKARETRTPTWRPTDTAYERVPSPQLPNVGQQYKTNDRWYSNAQYHQGSAYEPYKTSGYV